MGIKNFKVQTSNLKTNKQKRISLPLSERDTCSLNVGDMVLINGRLVTGRDRVHKFLFNERPHRKQIPFDLEGTILYHCGPIIKKTAHGFKIIAAGPTTSMRVEMYEHQLISEYGLRGIMGKGGMGMKTLNALKEQGSVYFNTIGGAAIYLAERVNKVVDVWKLDEFGMTEAMWLLDVDNFPAIVTMDAHGKSLHEEIRKRSQKEFMELINIR